MHATRAARRRLTTGGTAASFAPRTPIGDGRPDLYARAAGNTPYFSAAIRHRQAPFRARTAGPFPGDDESNARDDTTS
ncbi:hypothetical protein OG814_17045 [Streptomyces zaomyceticus]|uniref:Uncharacterized protein n=1 Tax=Streptomyces zaomyceticus TaxID=68286 RepID=A0ABZ1LEW4_9ACTN